MGARLKVVAVVLNWRQPTDTVAAVRSILGTSPSTEVVVVDNASGDGSVQEISRALPGIHLIENPSNDGYAGGNNAGIAWALRRGCEAVFVLNNDAVVREGCIETLEAALAGGAQIAGPLSRRADDPEVIDFYRAEVDVKNMAVNAQLRDERATPPPGVVPTGYATGSAMLIDASFLAEYGAFDPRYYLVWEDVDLCLRARKARGDAAVVAVPGAEVLHGRSLSFGGDGAPLFRYFEVRNSFLLAAMHLRGVRYLRTSRMLKRRYEGWLAKPGTHGPAARAIELGLRDGVAGRFGPPPDEVRALR